jgi:hypothetical protein
MYRFEWNSADTPERRLPQLHMMEAGGVQGRLARTLVYFAIKKVDDFIGN